MSPTSYGGFALLYSAGMILSGFGALGYDMAALRFMAVSNASCATPTQRSFFHFALTRVLTGAVVVALVSPLVLLVGGLMTATQAIALGLVIPFWSFLRLFASILRTEGRSGLSIVLDRIARDGSLLLLSASFVLLGRAASEVWPAAILFSATLAGCVAGAFFLRPFFNRSSESVDLHARPAWSSTARRLLVINGLELLSGRFDLFFLALISHNSIVGQMNIVLVVSGVAALPSVFSSFIVMPRIAAAHADNRAEDVLRDVLLSTTVNVGGAVLAGGFFIVGLAFSPDFALLQPLEAIPLDILAWMFLARVIISSVTAPAALLQMTGWERGVIWAHVAALGLKAGLYLSFAQVVGLRMAVFFCMVSAIAYAGMILVSLVVRKKTIGFT